MHFESTRLRQDRAAERGQDITVQIIEGRVFAPRLQLDRRAGEAMIGRPRLSDHRRRFVGTALVADEGVVLTLRGTVLHLAAEQLGPRSYTGTQWVRVPRDLYLSHIATAEERDTVEAEDRRLARGLDDETLTLRYRLSVARSYVRRLCLMTGAEVDAEDDVELPVATAAVAAHDHEPPPDDPTSADPLARPARVGQGPGATAYAHPAKVAVPA